MVDDLIVKFFQEDLTEAEEEALSGRLLSSTEDALRFGQHAEAAYHYYGLPEPQWPGEGPGAGRATASWKAWLWAAAVGLAGLAGWAWWHHGTKFQAVPGVPFAPKSGTPAPALSPAGGTVKRGRPAEPARSTRPSSAPLSPATVGSEAPASETPHAVAPEKGGQVAPRNIQTQPHASHSNLEVVVKRHAPGPVTVRVLSPDGNPAVLLYQGSLPVGNWAFEWNGRLADGSLPPPGTYRIQVESGGVTLRKSVVLREKQKLP